LEDGERDEQQHNPRRRPAFALPESDEDQEDPDGPGDRNVRKTAQTC
jgi:hypothetical protein